MAWHPQEKEIEALWREIPQHRYAYCLHHWVDEERLWSLWREGWVMMGSETQEEIFPVWPHRIFAQRNASGPWEGYEPREIPLKAWLEAWTPGLIRDRRRVGIFPTPEGRGLVLDPREVAQALAAEMANY